MKQMVHIEIHTEDLKVTYFKDTAQAGVAEKIGKAPGYSGQIKL